MHKFAGPVTGYLALVVPFIYPASCTVIMNSDYISIVAEDIELFCCIFWS